MFFNPNMGAQGTWSARVETVAYDRDNLGRPVGNRDQFGRRAKRRFLISTDNMQTWQRQPHVSPTGSVDNTEMGGPHMWYGPATRDGNGGKYEMAFNSYAFNSGSAAKFQYISFDITS